MRTGLVVSVGVALAALVALGCGASDAPQRARPDIILITIDTLRSDHLSCYGYARSTTPAIDEIAARGTVFEHAYAAAPWTMPSMASILTGVSPRTHGMRHGVFHPAARRISEQEALDPRFPTIATILHDAGYETFGLTTNAHLAAEVGYDRGFHLFAILPFKSAFRLDLAFDLWEERVRRAEPYFLWLHYFDPHAPYSAREPWIAGYDAPEGHEEWARLVTDELEAIAREGAPPRFREGIVDLYDSEIGYMDRSLKRILDALGPLDEAVVVISSDHGEELLDRGRIGHKHTLYDELVRVPLIFKLPSRFEVRPRVEPPVSNQDVLPTLLEIAGIDTPAGIEGASLLPLITGSADYEPAPVYADLDTDVLSADAIRFGRWKLIVQDRPEPRAMLFDLVADPGETTDVISSHPGVAADLTARLEQWRLEHPVFEPERASRTVSEPLMEQLRAMGYVE